jgi:hypothetical protein
LHTGGDQMMLGGFSGRSFFSAFIYQSGILSMNSFIVPLCISNSIFKTLTLPFKNSINQIDNIYLILQIN